MAAAAESPAVIDSTRPRIARLRERFAALGVDALLVSGEKDIRYLTGFIGHDSLLIVTADAAIIISDPRYDEFLDPWRRAGISVVMGVRHRLEESVKRIVAERGIRRIGFQAEQITVARRAKLAAAVGEDRLAETIGLVASLRMKKDAFEIAAIERAIDIQQHALAAAIEQLAVGKTELEFCARLEFEMKSRGAFGASFDPIIAAGANSSVIHYMTGQSRIEQGALLVDWGAIVDGYHSDMTRTFFMGEAPREMRTVYAIVLEAQLAAIKAIAPGKTCAEIDAVARKVIADAGYGDYFGHGLGHGLGMDTHEPPFFNNLQTDVVLEPGMVMTVEPGIYLPGVGGVRIEDDVLVTEGGCRVLSNWPKGLDEAVIDVVEKQGSYIKARPPVVGGSQAAVGTRP